MASTAEGAFCFRTAAHGYKRTALGRERDAVDGSVADLVEELARGPVLVGRRGVRRQRRRERRRGGGEGGAAAAVRLEEALGARCALLRRQAHRERGHIAGEQQDSERCGSRGA